MSAQCQRVQAVVMHLIYHSSPFQKHCGNNPCVAIMRAADHRTRHCWVCSDVHCHVSGGREPERKGTCWNGVWRKRASGPDHVEWGGTSVGEEHTHTHTYTHTYTHTHTNTHTGAQAASDHLTN